MKRKILLYVLLIVGIVSIVLGFVACKSDKSEDEQYKSAYEQYLDTYIEAHGSSEGALSEEEWLAFLQGTAKEEHHWNEGEITTTPTCITPGVITFECKDCGKTKKEVLDAVPYNHVYGDYQSNSTHHWQLCNLCGDVLKDEHNFDDMEEDLESEGYICRDCDYVDSFTNHAYKITFECSEGISVRVYNTQDYSVEGIKSFTAYSRDSDTGALLKDGSGQVNFEITVPKGFGGDILISPESGFKNLKDSTETGQKNFYRITKITSDLTVKVELKELTALYNFASGTDNEGDITFSWDSDFILDCVYANITIDGEIEKYSIDGRFKTWKFQNVIENKKFDFEFVFISDGEEIKRVNCSRFYYPQGKSVSFPRIEINTENYIWPTCEYISAPSGCWGAGITKNDYVYSTVNLYDKNNTLIYDSADELSAEKIYNGARIKIRGNTSAYSDKKPYKIKLAKKADLLSGLIDGRDNGVSYSDKEWLLLAGGSKLNQIIGWSVSETLQLDYTPSYSYVELYINGNYQGLYILCESVEQGSGTGDTQSRCKVDKDGFIVELDAYWWNEDLYFTTPLTETTAMHYTFKYPDSEDIDTNSEKYNYIKNYISEFEVALLSGDDSYLNYIDEEAFAKWLLAHDILADIDSGGSNIFLTKKDSSDSVLSMGPLWDFDDIKGAYDSFSRIRTENFYYFPLLLQKESFVQKYNELFLQVKDKIISNFVGKLANLDSVIYNQLLDIEADRWSLDIKSLETQKSSIIEWFEQHIAWLEENI